MASAISHPYAYQKCCKNELKLILLKCLSQINNNKLYFLSTYQFIWIDVKMVSMHYTDLEPHTNTHIRLFVAFLSLPMR